MPHTRRAACPSSPPQWRSTAERPCLPTRLRGFEVGEKKAVAVGVKFPSDEALHAWLKDPEYAATIAIRIATTDNLTMFIADAIEPGG